MYIFNDTTKGTPTFNSGLAVQFGGVSLNQEMNNEDGTFFVANTTGRDVLDFHHETANIKGRDGQYLYGATYKEREIEIQVRLTGYTDLGMRKQYERLNRLLFSRQAKKLEFGDDGERYYKEGSEIRILHLETQKYIRLKATYVQDSSLVINCETREITLNGRNELMNFDVVNSRYFKLQKGVNTFQVEGATLNDIQYKEVFA